MPSSWLMPLVPGWLTASALSWTMASWFLFSSIRERAVASAWSSCWATRFATSDSVNVQNRAASLAAGGKHALFDEGAVMANPHPFLPVSALSVRLAVRSPRSQPRCYPRADSNSVPPAHWAIGLPDMQSFLSFLGQSEHACRCWKYSSNHCELRRSACE